MRRLISLLLFLLAALPAAADEVRVRATLEPERIGLDQTATLSIEVQAGGFSSLRFRPQFELDNFEVVGGPYQYDDVRLGNGHLSRSVRLSWRLRAVSTGTARVRGLRIRMGNQIVTLGTREVQVQEEPTELSSPAMGGDEEDDFDRLFGRWTPPWAERPRQPDMFLRAEVRPLRPVVGQQVLYTVYLFTSTDVTAVTPSSLPDFQGFWVRDVPQPQRLPTDMVEVNGRRYGRVVVLQKALFPLRAGPHPIGPTEMELLARVVDRSFFGPPLSHPEEVHLRAPAMPLDVLPLPPAPAGFTGAVGRMSLTAQVEPERIRMGDAATVTLTLAGEGNLHGVPEPRFPEVPGLTILPPQQDGDDRVVGKVVRGSRTWSYAVVPERAGSFRLQLPQISYFDPGAGRYESASAPPLQITALRLPPPAGETARAPVESVRPERPEPDRPASQARGKSWRESLPWLLALPSALALVFVLVRRRQTADREARSRLERGLREARSEARPRHAAARIEESWRQFLAERWEIPPGTPSTRWGDLLAARGADSDAARELVQLADDLHYLRYAPQLSTCESLCGEVLERCRRLVRRLG